MNRDFENAGGILLTLLSFYFIWFASDFVPFRSEVTVYHASCKDVRGGCMEEASIKVTYKADSANQAVIYWLDDGAPYKYENCTVRNAENWQCEHGEKFNKVNDQMVNGEFSTMTEASPFTPKASKYEALHVVAKWKWWLIRLTRS